MNNVQFITWKPIYWIQHLALSPTPSIFQHAHAQKWEFNSQSHFCFVSHQRNPCRKHIFISRNWKKVYVITAILTYVQVKAQSPAAQDQSCIFVYTICRFLLIRCQSLLIWYFSISAFCCFTSEGKVSRSAAKDVWRSTGCVWIPASTWMEQQVAGEWNVIVLSL